MVISASKRMSSALIIESSSGLRFAANQCPYLSTEHDVPEIARLIHVEDDDRNFVIHAQTKRGGIHYLKTLGQRFGKRDPIVALGARIHGRVAVVNAVHFGSFQNNFRSNFARPQRGSGISRKIR